MTSVEEQKQKRAEYMRAYRNNPKNKERLRLQNQKHKAKHYNVTENYAKVLASSKAYYHRVKKKNAL